jgi:hypothetical protein
MTIPSTPAFEAARRYLPISLLTESASQAELDKFETSRRDQSKSKPIDWDNTTILYETTPTGNVRPISKTNRVLAKALQKTGAIHLVGRAMIAGHGNQTQMDVEAAAAQGLAPRTYRRHRQFIESVGGVVEADMLLGSSLDNEEEIRYLNLMPKKRREEIINGVLNGYNISARAEYHFWAECEYRCEDISEDAMQPVLRGLKGLGTRDAKRIGLLYSAWRGQSRFDKLDTKMIVVPSKMEAQVALLDNVIDDSQSAISLLHEEQADIAQSIANHESTKASATQLRSDLISALNALPPEEAELQVSHAKQELAALMRQQSRDDSRATIDEDSESERYAMPDDDAEHLHLKSNLLGTAMGKYDCGTKASWQIESEKSDRGATQ